MYKASELGYGRDLTVSRLLFTWQKQHPEPEEELEQPRRWPHSSKPVVLPPKLVLRETTDGERDRERAVADAVKSIQHVLDSPWHIFSRRDLEDVLPPAIIARAIDGYDTATDGAHRASAVRDLVGMAEDIAERAAEAIDTIVSEVLSLMLSDVQSAIGGGGASTNDLPKCKDDEWEWWKKNAFGMKQRQKGLRK